jgi:phospholipid/cholesterol/gamma-HCH transport system substrate-binding protein
MEGRINYTIVGLFVILLLAGLIAFTYWLCKYGGKQEYDLYYVYMSESVSGLSPDVSVKYMGVDVGTVEHIGINPRDDRAGLC